MQTDPKLLIKFPTRGRPEKFFQVLQTYIDKAKDLSKIAFLISMDIDDLSMYNSEVKNKLQKISDNVKLVYFYGYNKSKIEAINADMDKVSGWDILLLASDDMIPIVDDYDYIIRKDMNDHFRDMDGCLWYSDGGQNNICTLSILGKKYYDKFGYIYNPEYKSLWSDNEHTDVAVQLGKMYKSDLVIIEHKHPVYQKTNYDSLYIKNESFFYVDKEIYEKRKLKNFDLDTFNVIKFSILLLGIPQRFGKLEKLVKKLETQIGERSDIEVLALIDNKKRTVGQKRQNLIDISSGSFIAFIDDDDDVSENYISEIIDAICKNTDVDVITFNQIATINNDPPTPINFSIKNTNEEYVPGKPIMRKPFHMCAWNKKLTKNVKFPNISKTEDWFWLEEMNKLAKAEYKIDKFLHYYKFSNKETTAND